MNRVAAFCAVSLVSIVLTSPAHGAVCSFGLLSPVGYPVGINAGDITAADFNEDGRIDIAVVNRQTSKIAVRLGGAGGTLGDSASMIDITDWTQDDIASGDFNHDGHVDLIVAIPGPPNRVKVLLGNGDGTFGVTNGPDIFQNPGEFAIDDFNGDGKADVAVTAMWAGGNFATLINRGQLGLTDPSYHTIITEGDATNNVFAPPAITSGDFDGDGKRDIAVSVFWGDSKSIFHTNVYVFYGNGDGFQFTAAPAPIGVDLPGADPSTPAALAAGDLNGDGRDDIVAGYRFSDSRTAGTWLSVFMSNSGRTFAPEVKYAVDSLGQVAALQARDIDGDGNIDIIAGAFGVQVYRGHGDGTLTLAKTVEVGAQDVALADLDQDGGIDVISTDFYNGAARVLLNTCGLATPALISSANPAEQGLEFDLTATITPPPAATPTGTITIKRGSEVLATGSLSTSLSLMATVGDLLPGSYVFTASYSGDSRFAPSETALTQVVQVPPFGAPRHLNAVAAPQALNVDLSWIATTGVDHYEVWRGNGAGWAPVIPSNTTPTNHFIDNSVQAGVAYLYKVRGISPTGIASDFSKVDLAVSMAYTDEPIEAGVTTIKLAHLFELRAAVDLARGVNGLASYPWADQTPSTVLASHWTELRDAIVTARAPLALPPATFTDTPVSGGAIRALHVNELRDALR